MASYDNLLIQDGLKVADQAQQSDNEEVRQLGAVVRQWVYMFMPFANESPRTWDILHKLNLVARERELNAVVVWSAFAILNMVTLVLVLLFVDGPTGWGIPFAWLGATTALIALYHMVLWARLRTWGRQHERAEGVSR